MFFCSVAVFFSGSKNALAEMRALAPVYVNEFSSFLLLCVVVDFYFSLLFSSLPIFVASLFLRHLACVTYFLHFLLHFVFIFFSFNSCYRVPFYISRCVFCVVLCDFAWNPFKRLCCAVFILVVFLLAQAHTHIHTYTSLNYK